MKKSILMLLPLLATAGLAFAQTPQPMNAAAVRAERQADVPARNEGIAPNSPAGMNQKVPGGASPPQKGILPQGGTSNHPEAPTNDGHGHKACRVVGGTTYYCLLPGSGP